MWDALRPSSWRAAAPEAGNQANGPVFLFRNTAVELACLTRIPFLWKKHIQFPVSDALPVLDTGYLPEPLEGFMGPLIDISLHIFPGQDLAKGAFIQTFLHITVYACMSTIVYLRISYRHHNLG